MLRRAFSRTKFPVEVINAALDAASDARATWHAADEGLPGWTPNPNFSFEVTVRSHETWELDTLDEFFAEYRKPNVWHAHLGVREFPIDLSLYLGDEFDGTKVMVKGQTRADVLRVIAPFEEAAHAHRLPDPVEEPKVTVFLGHGRSADWRDLSDHLRDQHQYDVIAFETGPRAGYTAKEVLERLVADATMAVLVHTAEDEQADESLRARENVVHETGLFQGRLGFARAIIVREEGCGSFSNVAGVQELRYRTAIRETFGDVLAVIRREFG